MTKKIYEKIAGVLCSHCTSCDKHLPLDSFRKRSVPRKSDGAYMCVAMCKVCENEYNLKHHHENRKANGVAVKAGYKYTLKTLYSLSVDEFNTMHKDQDGCCAICKEPVKNIFIGLLGKQQAVDHCHTTGNVRQILCMECNTGLGKFKDDINTMREAIKYLEKHATNS